MILGPTEVAITHLRGAFLAALSLSINRKTERRKSMLLYFLLSLTSGFA